MEHSEYIVGGWPWRILGANFENFNIRGRFSKKRKISHKIVTSCVSVALMYLGVLFPFLPLESLQNHSLECTLRTRTVPTQFSPTPNVRYCVLKSIRRYAAWRLISKKSRLNWKLNIINTADNADITQSLARDTRHCRMQEVNGLCTGSRLLRIEYCIVSFHTIQPSG